MTEAAPISVYVQIREGVFNLVGHDIIEITESKRAGSWGNPNAKLDHKIERAELANALRRVADRL